MSMSKKTTIVGISVPDGLVTIGPRRTAVNLRKQNGEIVVEELSQGSRMIFFEKLPLFRGCIRWFRQLWFGSIGLLKSVTNSQAIDEESPDSPSQSDAGAPASTAASRTSPLSWFAVVMGVLLSIVFLWIFPRFATDVVARFFPPETMDTTMTKLSLNMIEACLRVLIFLTYVAVLGKTKEVARMWQYQGAVQKTISCYERGVSLNREEVKKSDMHHYRCGSSFLFLIVILSILALSFFDAFIEDVGTPEMILLRILLLPVMAGVMYEILRIIGRFDTTAVGRVLLAPIRWLQKLTVREPAVRQIDLAIIAVEAVLPENGREDRW